MHEVAAIQNAFAPKCADDFHRQLQSGLTVRQKRQGFVGRSLRFNKRTDFGFNVHRNSPVGLNSNRLAEACRESISAGQGRA